MLGIFGITALILDGTMIGLVFMLLGFILFLNRKLNPVKPLLQAKSGKLCIITDRAKNVWFVPVVNNQVLTWIREFGIRTFDKDSTYFAPQLLANVGIFSGDCAVNLPIELWRAVKPKKNKPGEQPKIEEKERTPEEIAIEKVEKRFTQVDIENFIQFLGRNLDSLRLQSLVEWRAKRLSALQTLDKGAEGFNKKWLILILIVGIIGVLVFLFLG